MSRQKIVKTFEFIEEFRSSLTFSDSTKIFLDSKNNRIALRRLSFDRSKSKPVYSIDLNLSVTIAQVNPLAIKAWAGIGTTPRPTLQPTGATIGYKLNDGTVDKFWNGSAWVTATLTDWMTEVVMSANIATYPVTTKKLSIVINLVTTDANVTPTVESIDLQGDYDVSYLRSIVADSFIPELRENTRSQVDYLIRHEGGDKVFIKNFEVTPYNIVSVTEVFNDTTDLDRVTNLFDTFDSTDQVINLTASVDSGDSLFIRFTAECEVALNWSNQDYTETAHLPAIVLDTFSADGNVIWGEQVVKNIGTFQASVRREPTRLNITFAVQLIAESNRTLLEMMDKILDFASNTPVLTWRDLDIGITLTMMEEGILNSRPNLRDRHQASYLVKLHEVNLWFKPETTKALVKKVNLTLKKPDQ